MFGATVAAVAVVGMMAAAAPAKPAPTLTNVQPGHTARPAAPDTGDWVGGEQWANFTPRPDSAPASTPQPAQTEAPVGVGDLPTSSAPRITEALQPGQTVSEIGPSDVSISGDRQKYSTPAFAPSSAPQPGQTGW
jgi:hypothetical protein